MTTNITIETPFEGCGENCVFFSPQRSYTATWYADNCEIGMSSKWVCENEARCTQAVKIATGKEDQNGRKENA